MNWPEKSQMVIDWTLAQGIAGVSTIDAITPVEEFLNINANAVAFDMLGAVANHLYFIENVTVMRTVTMAGNPFIQGYDIGAVARIVFAGGQTLGTRENFWITRLAHLPNGATAGQYSIIYTGFDLTFS